MFQLRRTAFRLLSNPSVSFASKSRSITSITRPSFKTPYQTSASSYQRRWISDEAEKSKDIDATLSTEPAAEVTEPAEATAAVQIEKEAPTPEEEVENVEHETEAPVESKSTVESVAEGVKNATSTVAEVAQAATSNSVDDSTPRVAQSPFEREPTSSVYIGNLFYDVTETDLETEFGRFGPIEQAVIVRDGKGLSKGFGYVNFTTVEAAGRAREMDREIYEGRRIMVQYAQKSARPRRERTFTLNPPSTTLFLGNMAFEMTDRDLNNVFKGIRNVIDVRVAIDKRTGQPRGFAHADFIDVKSAVEAQKALSEKEMYGRKLRVDFSISTPRKPHPTSSGAEAPGATSE